VWLSGFIAERPALVLGFKKLKIAKAAIAEIITAPITTPAMIPLFLADEVLEVTVDVCCQYEG